MTNKWKVIGIVFMCLFVVQILFMFYVASLGNDVIAKAKECDINICDFEDALFYEYDYTTGICYCYGVNGDILEQEILG